MENKGAADGRVSDPVCGMRIDPASASGSAEYGGQQYFFCSVSCQSKFKTDPARYAGPAQAGGASRG
jgi:Cu+-exporting ATPase